MTNTEQSTGLKIRKLRHKLNKRQSEIAANLAISIPAYSKIESGITDINLTRLIQIAELFDVSPAALLSGVDMMEAVNEKYKQYDRKITDLQDHVLRLQTKLINAYEELDHLKSNAIKLNQ